MSVDNSSLAHIHDKKKGSFVGGKSQTEALNDTVIAAEA